jgi:flagellar basal body rod protein FlgG
LNGNLVTRPGVKLEIPQETREVAFDPDGTVRADNVEIGKLKLVRFANERDDLLKDGLTWFVPKDATVQPLEASPTTTVEQGYLEDANVNAVSGMNELIIVSRSFESLIRVIETFRDLDNRTARDVGGRG